MDVTYHLAGAPKPPTRRFADLDGPDFYPTPEWATQALIEHEDFEGLIWEPACGDGSMARVLEATGSEVLSTDLYDRGFGRPGEDFLASNRVVDNIITNPPFNSAEAFVAKGLSASRKKLALLLRLAFLEGGNRYRTIFRDRPPTRTWVFSERITFYPANAVRAGSGTTAYAWFVWDKGSSESAQLKWLPPGYKSRAAANHGIKPDLFK
jgi:hypothetical protein